MKTLLLSVSCLIYFSFIAFTISAQELHPVSGKPLKYCGTTEATQEFLKKYPHLKDATEIIENQQKSQTENPAQNKRGTVYTVPVVFHILHNYGPENIPDANIYDAMRILNEDFRKLNTDISQVVPAFQGITGDAEIEFQLAKLDPNGNCTNGIDRIVTSKTYKAGDNSKLNMWPRNEYLNIWTVNNIASGAAGYTYLPATAAGNPAIDGIIILYDYVGSLTPSSPTTSRALGHEVGHWFNLPHVWGSTNQPGVACGDDGVTDTPVTKGWTVCNLTTNDVCTAGVQENVQNIMEYAYCQKMFTVGQCARMKTAIESSTAQRNNLWTTTNLALTGIGSAAQLCHANFSLNKNIICYGDSVTFSDLSWNTPPTSWQWDFDNNGTTDATTQNPTYKYTAPGTYSVKLIVSDGISSQTTTKLSLVIVLSNTPNTFVPYSESFENTSFPYSDFLTTSASGDTTKWDRSTTAAYTGSASLKLNNYSPTTGDVDEFITPSIDMSTITNPTMSFKVAYQRKSSSDTLDRLRVLTSTNCGIAWVQKYSKNFANLPSVGSVSSSAFTPSSISQWRQETINISSAAGAPELRFRFEFTGHGVGNNIYVDDININGTLSVEEEFKNEFDLNVFPNPCSENTTISFNIHNKYKVALGFYDIVGKEIISMSNAAELAAGTYSLPLNQSNLVKGIYFVKLEVNGYTVTKKVLVQ